MICMGVMSGAEAYPGSCMQELMSVDSSAHPMQAQGANLAPNPQTIPNPNPDHKPNPDPNLDLFTLNS